MTSTAESYDQALYIERYLSGEWPIAPKPSPRREAEGWMRALIDDPDLDQAEDIIDAALPATRGYVPAPPIFGPAQAERDTEGDRQSQKSGLWRSISNILFYAALVAVVLSAVILGNKSGGSSRFFGFQYFEVLSESMQSVIPKGSLVITRAVPSGEIKVGDDITFVRGDEQTVTHRVVEIVRDFDGRGSLGFRTQGTDNLEPDPDIVGAANVLGVVRASVKNLGFTLRYIADNIKYVFIAFVLIILLSIALRVLLGERGESNGIRVRQPRKGCGHIKFWNGRKGEPPGERNKQLCKRHTLAA